MTRGLSPLLAIVCLAFGCTERLGGQDAAARDEGPTALPSTDADLGPDLVGGDDDLGGRSDRDAQPYDSGWLPEGYTTECVRMEREGCYNSIDGCMYGTPSLLERNPNAPWLCRCGNWPVATWEPGQGYHARCDGQERNLCRTSSGAEPICDLGLVCTGAPVGRTSSAGMVVWDAVGPYRCGHACSATVSCARVDAARACCAVLTSTSAVCLGTTSPELGCAFPATLASACLANLPNCP